MSNAIHSFINRARFAYSFLDLPEYQECTNKDSLFGYSYSFEGIRQEVQIKAGSIVSGDLHVDIHHVDSDIIEISIPSREFFSELDKSVQKKYKHNVFLACMPGIKHGA